MSKRQLRVQLQQLKAMTNRQQRGFALEKLLNKTLDRENLKPTAGYRPNGEQVDGFFEMEGRFFLLECKWKASRVPASEIYAFRAKVEGKLIGTIGVFISMNGFSKDVQAVLSHGKDLNVLLFNSTDLAYALTESHTFTKILKVKMRPAQFGEVYYTFRRHLDEANV